MAGNGILPAVSKKLTNNKISPAFYGKGDFFPLHLMSNILIMALLMLKIIQLRQKW
jgi:hypothetical protein